MASRRRQGQSVRRILDRLIEVQYRKDTIRCGHGLLDIAIHAADAFNRVGQVHRIRQEGHQRTGRDLAIDDLIAAEPDDDRHGQSRQEFHGRRQKAHELHILHRCLEVQLILVMEAPNLISLPDKRLHDAHRRDTLLQKRGDIRQPLLDDRARGFQLAAKDLHGLTDHRDRHQGQDAELPIEIDHHHQRPDENRALGDQLDEIVHQRALQGRHIIGDVAHDLAGLPLVIIGKRHALEFAEQNIPDIYNNTLADKRHEIALSIVKNSPKKEYDHDADRYVIEHRHVAICQHLIDHILDDPRHIKVRGRSQDDADDGNAQTFQIRLDIRKQPQIVFHKVSPDNVPFF